MSVTFAVVEENQMNKYEKCWMKCQKAIIDSHYYDVTVGFYSTDFRIFYHDYLAIFAQEKMLHSNPTVVSK